MKLVSLEVKNFRNHKNTAITFSDGLNVLYGDNAAGKTNLVESIYFCSSLQSFNATKDKEMINKDAEVATIKAVISKKFRNHTISIQIDLHNKKRVLVDGLPVKRAGELLGVLGVVLFTTQEIEIVKGAPVLRRRFLDVSLSQRQQSYFMALSRYNKCLEEKNNLLKEIYKTPNIDDMLDIWDTSLAKEGAVLIKKRIEFIDELSKEARIYHKALSSGKEELAVSYESDVNILDIEHIEENLKQAIVLSRAKDKELGYSTVGPHRDDIKLSINGDDSRKYASNGQKRTITLALKLGEVSIYKKETGESPVLLLDDVLSELDESRRLILMDLTNNIQTILTTPSYELNTPAKTYLIKNGEYKG